MRPLQEKLRCNELRKPEGTCLSGQSDTGKGEKEGPMSLGRQRSWFLPDWIFAKSMNSKKGAILRGSAATKWQKGS